MGVFFFLLSAWFGFFWDNGQTSSTLAGFCVQYLPYGFQLGKLLLVGYGKSCKYELRLLRWGDGLRSFFVFRLGAWGLVRNGVCWRFGGLMC